MGDVRKITVWVILITGGILFSCRKEDFLTSPDVRLSFSTDTVFFDTIFTTIGSTTRYFTVHNPYNKRVKIASVRLGRGASSPYRLNVDGVAGKEVDDLEINPRDSLYVFVEVTINPLGGNMPLLVKDSVVFRVNDQEQDVDLVAWGQDVHLVDGQVVPTQTWENDKPYLIIHSMLVDTSHTLTIRPGVKIYSHFNSTIYVSGTLIVQGTVEEPVLFSGDRPEEMYDDIPGQWSGIYFLNGSNHNLIDHAVIQNGIYGVHLGNFYSADSFPDLHISNTIIQHMTFAGISSVGARIRGENCVVADCGSYALSLTTGGDYRFVHCTIANYWNWSNRTNPSLLLTNYYNLGDTVVFTGALERADFLNMIIYGNKESEVGLSSYSDEVGFQYFFDHCLLKVKDPEKYRDTTYYRKVFLNNDPGFVGEADYDFQLDSLAFARDKGDLQIGLSVPADLLGNDRTADGHPDLGAYERIDSITSR